jgi:thiamine biosynthesis lipoprotein
MLPALLVLAVLVAAAVISRLGGRSPSPASDQTYISLTREIMTTPITVMAPAEKAQQAAEIVFSVFRDVDERMSEWKPTSPLSVVNAKAGIEPVAVPNDLRAILRRGVELGELTDGAFDVTWAALWGLWDFKSETPRVPEDDEIATRIALINFRRIEIDDAAGTVFLPEENMMLGLGGIAKGHALDRAAAELRAAGIDSFLISAGGQMMLGGQRDDRPWRVGIRDPRGGIDGYFAYLELTDASVSTSGDYERFFILDGVRYHHILDPRTGWPARGLRSATVISADATLADALSTAFMILGRERALALIEELDGLEAVLVDADGSVHVTGGLEGVLRRQGSSERR